MSAIVKLNFYSKTQRNQIQEQKVFYSLDWWIKTNNKFTWPVSSFHSFVWKVLFRATLLNHYLKLENWEARTISFTISLKYFFKEQFLRVWHDEKRFFFVVLHRRQKPIQKFFKFILQLITFILSSIIVSVYNTSVAGGGNDDPRRRTTRF